MLHSHRSVGQILFKLNKSTQLACYYQSKPQDYFRHACLTFPLPATHLITTLPVATILPLIRKRERKSLERGTFVFKIKAIQNSVGILPDPSITLTRIRVTEKDKIRSGEMIWDGSHYQLYAWIGGVERSDGCCCWWKTISFIVSTNKRASDHDSSWILCTPTSLNSIRLGLESIIRHIHLGEPEAIGFKVNSWSRLSKPFGLHMAFNRSLLDAMGN